MAILVIFGIFLGKTNLKSISTNLPKMAINWHKIGQMPLGHFSYNFDDLTFFFSKCSFFKDKSNSDIN